jgi:hypothetical protein
MLAYGPRLGGDDKMALNPGIYDWQNSDEKQINDPSTLAALQEAAQTNSKEAYKLFRVSFGSIYIVTHI